MALAKDLTERTIRLEADRDNMKRQMDDDREHFRATVKEMEKAITGAVEKFNEKIDELPSEKSITLLIENHTNSLVQKHFDRCRKAVGGLSAKHQIVIGSGFVTGLGALLKVLFG